MRGRICAVANFAFRVFDQCDFTVRNSARKSCTEINKALEADHKGGKYVAQVMLVFEGPHTDEISGEYQKLEALISELFGQ